MTPAGFPHSDTPGSQLGCQLPRAYRRLQRPSSALDAKASTMCPSQLVSQTLNKNNKRHTPPPANQPGSRATTKTKDNNLKNLVVARCSRPLSTNQTPHPPTPTPQTTSADQGKEALKQPNPPHQPGNVHRPAELTGLIPQGPTVCQNQPPTHRTPRFHTPSCEPEGSSCGQY